MKKTDTYVLSLTKNCLGSNLGDFFTNSSGHPARGSLTLKLFIFLKKIIRLFIRRRLKTL
jgi:hypothetical protein